ncbi:MAG: aminoglycoside phosphotransferase [Ilumatobacteraceae bacterium]|nr:aminoglycoside phosphotransferase [Ilumatobacteraceae bacterium]
MTATTTQLDHARIREVVRLALDRPDAEVASIEVAPSAHVVDNMTTESLHHVSGTLVDGTPWRLFAKVLQPASASPVMAFVPPDHHASLMANLNWLDEPRVYRSDLRHDVPDGLTMPEVHAIDEVGDRIVLWLEHIDDTATWDLSQYTDAAHLLGRLSGRWPEERVGRELGIERRDLGYLFFGKLSMVDIPLVTDDELWRDPVLRSVADDGFREDLQRLIELGPVLIGMEARLPHGLCHGDATPHNLLRDPAGDLVAVDWSYGCRGPYGSDLGQLVAGRFDAGDADPADAPRIAAVVLDAYLDGLAAERAEVDRAAVEAGWAIHLAIRSAISAPLVDPREDLDDEARAAALARRIAVARIGIDLALACAG